MKAGAWLALVCVLVVAWQVDRRGQRSAGQAEGRAEESAKRVKAADSVIRVTDTVYFRDTVRLRTILTRWDSVRTTDTLTVVRNDTVRVYVSREVADSAVSLCRLTVFSCERRVAARDSAIAGLRSQLQAVKASEPSRLATLANRGLWLAAGAGIMAIVGR